MMKRILFAALLAIASLGANAGNSINIDIHGYPPPVIGIPAIPAPPVVYVGAHDRYYPHDRHHRHYHHHDRYYGHDRYYSRHHRHHARHHHGWHGERHHHRGKHHRGHRHGGDD